jgi:hypothetical protein
MTLCCDKTFPWLMIIFSSPELKAQVSFSDRPLSGIRLSVLPSDCPSVNFYIFNFFSRTTEPILTKLGTNHPWRKGIQVCTNERDSPFPRGDNSERVKIHWNFFLNLLLQNQQAKFNQAWYKLSLGEGNSSLFQSRARSPSKGR